MPTVHPVHQLPQQPTMHTSAYITTCGKHRLTLYRRWAPGKAVLFIMCNPSTADAEKDDPTLRRCIGYAKRWGFGALYVGNLFSLRATDPKQLRTETDIVHRDNIFYLRAMASKADLIVCAWGNAHITDRLLRSEEFSEYKPFAQISKPLHYLQLTNDGTPKHPLYLPLALDPIPYTAPSYTR